MLKSLINISNKQLILPFYHLVSDITPNYIKHLYEPKNIRKFKDDLDVFLKYYNPISLKELLEVNKGKKRFTKPSFHLTFDDGLSNFYHIIAPILLKKGISATIFLNTDFVDNKELFYRYKASLLIDNYLNINKKRKKIYSSFIKKKTKGKKQEIRDEFIINYLLKINYKNRGLLDELATQINYSFDDFLKNEKPYLTLKQIKILQKQGFTFGAHSCNHPNYSELELKEQLNQTKKSVKWLQDNLSVNYKVFSFPFHDIGVSKMFYNKIKPNLDLSFGTSGIKNDEILTNLHRLDMEKNKQNIKPFLIKEYLKYIFKTPFGRNTIKRN